MKYLRIIKSVFIKDLRIFLRYKFNFLLTIFTMLMYLFLISFFSESFIFKTNEREYDVFTFFFLGLLITDITVTCSSAPALKIAFYQTSGIIEEIVSDYKNFYFTIISSMAFPFLFALIKVGIYLFFSYFFFYDSFFINSSALLIFLFLPIYIFGLMGVCLLASSFTLIFKRGNPIIMLNNTLTAIFSGAFIPVDTYSNTVNFFTNFIPGRHMLELIRMFASGPLIEKNVFIFHVALLFIISSFLLMIGSIALSYAVKFTKLNNTISNY